jgi:hypothetical protein
MARDAFRDPAGIVNGGAWWEWPIGHEAEDPEINTLSLERTAVTTGVGYVRQQGTPSPKQRGYKGWIVQPTQLNTMTAFYNACAGVGGPSRTILYRDLDGSEHEVLITDWEPNREMGNAGGTFLGYVWKYTLKMEMIT